MIQSLNQTTSLYWHTRAKDTLYSYYTGLCLKSRHYTRLLLLTTLWYQNKDMLLGKSVAVVPLRTCYLFTLLHPPSAPLSTTREQMVHSRRRVTESPWRKCNCFSNYVLTATEQWESTRPQLFIENPERGRLFWGLTWTRWTTTQMTADWRSDNNAHWSCCLFSASAQTVCPALTVLRSRKQRGDRNDCSRHLFDKSQSRGVTFSEMFWMKAPPPHHHHPPKNVIY